MKICHNCKHHNRAPVQVSPGQAHMIDVCMSEDLRNPVDGTPMPCNVLRSNEIFCGILGKKFQGKPKEEKKDATNVIQLAG